MRDILLNPKTLFFTLLQLFHIAPLSAQMEMLDLGLITRKTSGNFVYVEWRMFGTDHDNIAFNIYRNNIKITGSLIINSTNYTDANGSSSALYHSKLLFQ